MRYFHRSKQFSFLKLLIVVVLISAVGWILSAKGIVTINKGNQSSTRVAQFSIGKIAYIKSGNIWIAENDGKAKAITTDSTEKISENYTASLKYHQPAWSPDGKYLAFGQNIGYNRDSNLFIWDGTKIRRDISQFTYRDNYRPFWVAPGKLLLFVSDKPKQPEASNIPTNFVFYTLTITGDSWGTNEPGDPFFNFDAPLSSWGCGGGGRPQWSYTLSHNHGGGMDGIRSTFLYSKNQKTLFFSTGCEQGITSKVELGAPTTSYFSNSFKPDATKPSTENSSPRELFISENEDQFVGTINRNVFLFDTSGNVKKQLTSTNKAYGPVFSQDGTNIYFADNFGDKPQLKAIATNGSNQVTLFEGIDIGAISNIATSPDAKQIAFTLITQTSVQHPEMGDWGSTASQDVYIINIDGSNPRILAKDASEPAWSK